MWGRELCRILRIPPLLALGLATLTVLSAFLFGGLLAAITVSRVGDEFPPDAVPIIARASLAGVWLTSGLVTTVFVVTAPPRTMLQSLLELLPVRRSAAVVGQLAPMTAVTTVFCLALSLPTIALFTRLFDGVALVRGILVILACIALVQTLCVSAFLSVGWALRRTVRLGRGYADALAAVAVIAGVMAMTAGDLLTRDVFASADSDVLPHRALGSIASGQATTVSVLTLVLWVAAAALLARVAVGVPVSGADPRTPLFLQGSRPANGVFLPLLWAEVVVAVRTIQFVTTVLSGVAVVVGAILLAHDPATADLARALAALAPVIPFALGVYAVGRSLTTRWIAGHAVLDRRAWATAAAAAAGVLGAVASAPLLLAVVVAGILPIELVAQVVGRAALGGALAVLAGAVIPISTEQPVSATASAFLFGVLLLGSSVGLSAVADAGGPTAAMSVAMAATVAAIVLYLLVCSRHPLLDRTHG
jgi:hypothetical protein